MSTGTVNPQSQPPVSNRGDEIDLRAFFKEIGHLFNQMANSIILLLVWIRRNTLDHIVLIIAIIVLFIAFQFGQRRLLRDPSYSSTMILRSQHLNGPLLEKYIEKLNQDFRTRSELLQVDSSVAGLIQGFSIEPFITEEEIVEFELFKQDLLANISEEEAAAVIERLRLENRATYEIGIELSADTVELLGQIEESLLKYISENSYVKKRLEIEKRELEASREKINEELNGLDDLKSILISNLIARAKTQDKGSNNVILGDNPQTDPLSVFREHLNYYFREQSIKRQLYLRPSFEVIDGFSVLEESNGQTWFDSPLRTIMYGIGIAYAILFLIQFNKYLARKEQQVTSS